MALGNVENGTAKIGAECQQDTLHALVEFNGDDAYTAGGTENFTQWFREVLCEYIEPPRSGNPLPNPLPACLIYKPSPWEIRSVKCVAVYDVKQSADPDNEDGLNLTPKLNFDVRYDSENDKLIVLDAGAEVADATDLSACWMKLEIVAC